MLHRAAQKAKKSGSAVNFPTTFFSTSTHWLQLSPSSSSFICFVLLLSAIFLYLLSSCISFYILLYLLRSSFIFFALPLSFLLSPHSFYYPNVVLPRERDAISSFRKCSKVRKPLTKAPPPKHRKRRQESSGRVSSQVWRILHF